MAAVSTISINGASGKTYNFNVYPLSSLGNFKEFKCCYAFTTTAYNPVADREILYIGETVNAKNRLTNSHEKVPCVRRNGGRYICIHATDSHVAVEKDLLANRNPVCND